MNRKTFFCTALFFGVAFNLSLVAFTQSVMAQQSDPADPNTSPQVLVNENLLKSLEQAGSPAQPAYVPTSGQSYAPISYSAGSPNPPLPSYGAGAIAVQPGAYGQHPLSINQGTSFLGHYGYRYNGGVLPAPASIPKSTLLESAIPYGNKGITQDSQEDNLLNGRQRRAARAPQTFQPTSGQGNNTGPSLYMLGSNTNASAHTPEPKVGTIEERQAIEPEVAAAPSSNDTADEQAADHPRETLVSVRFETRKSTFASEEKQKIESVSQRLVSDKSLQIILQAFALGDDQNTTRRLALRRALNVRELLIDAGVDAERIEVRANKSDSGEGDRVDIQI